MAIANVNVALIFDLQILEKVILLLKTKFTNMNFQNKPSPCITRLWSWEKMLRYPNCVLSRLCSKYSFTYALRVKQGRALF